MRFLILFFLLLISYAVLCQSLHQVDSLLHNAQYAKAIEQLSSTRINQSDEHKILLQNKLAEALIYSGNYEKAKETLDNIKTTDRLQQAVTLTNYGLLHMNLGRHDLGLESLEKSISIFDSLGKSESLGAAQAISNLGIIYNATGKTTQAQEQLQMALTIREKLLPPNHILLAASYNDLGLAFATTDNDKALDYYERALKIYQSVYGNDHPKIAIALVNNGFVYRDLELYGDAINNFENAIKIWDKVYPGSHPSKAFALLNLGDTYLRMQNLKAAQGYYDRALQMYRDSYGEQHPDIAQVLNSLGNLELNHNNFDKAIAYYQLALKANSLNFDPASIESNPDLKEYYNGRVLLYSLLNKAEAFEKKYFGKTLKLKDLQNSITTLLYCDSLVDQLRQRSSNESDKIALGAIANDVYAAGVRIANETALNALNKKQYIEQAFYFADKSKSAVLLEAISDANAKSFSGIPQSLMEEEKTLKSVISLAAQKLSQKPSPEEEKSLRELSYNLNRSYEVFIKKLEADFPGYFNLKYNSSSPSLKEIQKSLGEKTAVLSYFIDEANARLYTFLITQKNIRLFETGLVPEFDRYITGLRNSLFFSEIKTFKLTATKLGKMLIPKIPSRINELVILPSGRLSIIPFESLLLSESEKINEYENLPYLVNKYDVKYEFSASLLLEKTKRKMAGSNSIFLCAPVNFPHEDLGELPGTESEVKEIAGLFEKNNYATSVRLRDEANESFIKENGIEKHALIHFATHGIVDERNPELSRIFLQAGQPNEDGNLFSGEIYNLRLNANLVTLSACQTGLGKISKGEGVIGLSRALVYAGARNIVVSYWSVADESTAELMKNFYTQILQNGNDNYSKSLRNAKLSLIRNVKYASPYYWAPFILIGY